MSELNLKLAAPNPTALSAQVRETITTSFMLQLDQAYENKEEYMTQLVNSGHVTISSDGKVDEISNYLRDAITNAVNDVTQACGFGLIRNAQLARIGADGLEKPLVLTDYLSSTPVIGEATKFVKMVMTVTVEPASAEETLQAMAAYSKQQAQS